MKNFDLKQNISDANASGRGYSSAPLNIFSNPFDNSQKVKSGQSGRSMIEMLGVLAIIGVLSVGGIAGYSKAMHKYRINKTIEQITLIAGNVRSFFAPQRSYEGLGTCSNDNNACKLIKKAKLMPDEMWDDTDKQFNNVFGYGVGLMAADRSANNDKKAFEIGLSIYSNIDVCIDLLSHDWRAANVSFIFATGFDDETDRFFIPPAEIDKVVETCAHATDDGPDGETNLRFYFDADVIYYKTKWSYGTWY